MAVYQPHNKDTLYYETFCGHMQGRITLNHSQRLLARWPRGKAGTPVRQKQDAFSERMKKLMALGSGH